jgi:transcriptional regulator with XRE-family HTH domain
MSSAARERPVRLPEKLKAIREALGLSQGGIIIRIGYEGSQVTRSVVSKFELGKREPSLLVLYAYAQAANVSSDVLLDDELDLPALIPSPEKSMGRKKRK